MKAMNPASGDFVISMVIDTINCTTVGPGSAQHSSLISLNCD